MRLLYDLAATQPNAAKFHGGGEYAKVVFARLVEMADEAEVTGFYHRTADLPEPVASTASEHSVELVGLGSRSGLESLIAERSFDRFYTAAPYGYHDIDFADLDLTLTIHGLRFIEVPTDAHESKFGSGAVERGKAWFKSIFPQWYTARKIGQLRRLLDTRGTLQVIVPSLHTKYSLLSFFPDIDGDCVRVLGCPMRKLPDVDGSEVADTLAKYDVERDGYFLLVSAGRWVKNAYRAVRAFDDLVSSTEDGSLRMVLVGASPGGALRRVVRNRDRFRFDGYVPKRRLAALYESALAFVYPSLNEGFGYPPVEAMRYGTPVAASGTAAVPEICGDAALYFNPLMETEIRNRLLMLSRESDLRRRLTEVGRRRYEKIVGRQEQMLAAICATILGRA